MNDDWTAAAAHFGLSPEEAAEHKRGWEDLQLFGAEAFVNQTYEELKAALAEAKRIGQPPDPAAQRRLQARHDIIVTMTEAASHEIMQQYLEAYDGPRH